MSNNLLKGTFPVIPTPFTENGDVDLNSFESVIDYIIACGVDGVVFPGLASEYAYLSHQERLEMTQFLGTRLNGNTPFIVGASAATPQEAIEYCVSGAKAGANCAMVMAPNIYAKDKNAMVNFYKEIARKAGIPIMLQNAPAPMGAGLPIVELVDILRQVPEIEYVKEETQPCGQRIEEIITNAPSTLKGVFGGAGGRYIIDELKRNALGTVPACELTEMHTELVNTFSKGDYAKALNIYCDMMPILNMQAVYRCSLTKHILFYRGIIACPQVRDPGPRLDEKNRHELVELYQKLSAYMPPLTLNGKG